MNHGFLAHARKDEITGRWQIHSLEDHLKETAIFSKKFAKKIGLDLTGELLGLLHDLGKYSLEYQCYLKSAVGMLCKGDKNYVDAKRYRGKIDHSTAGSQLLSEAFRDEIKISKLLGEMVSLCALSHHGSGLIDVYDIGGENKFSARVNKDFALTHYPEVTKKINHVISVRIGELINSEEKIDQLRNLISWIHGFFSGQIRSFTKGLLVRFLFSCLVDADRLSTSDFENPLDAELRYHGCYPDWQKLIDCFEGKSFEIRNEVDKKRCEISSSCRQRANDKQGHYYLTVPTGGGKTFASLRFALHHALQHKLDRIIYVIPYTSIIDQNASEVARIFNVISKGIVLEHHSNLSPEKDTWRNRILSENWDAPIVFTTSVQLLETLFGGGTRCVRRMHQLARSVIIFDEIQTLPIKTVHMFNNAINFLTYLCSSTVVFCTATQPVLHGVDPYKGAVPYSDVMELVDYPPLFATLKRVVVQDCLKNGGWMEEELSEEIKELLYEKGSVLVVTNTKPNAKHLYGACIGIAENLFHLSTDMCPKHRKEVLGKVIACLDPTNPKQVVCISTQLIEAGVDVDFGAVIRCLAGLDSIAQAAGRCNRNGRQKEGLGLVKIVNLRNENLDRLTEIRTAQEVTLRILGEYHKNPVVFDEDIIGHKAMKQFYKYYFYERAREMSYPLTRNELGHKDDLLSLLSTNQQSVDEHKRKYGSPTQYLRQSFMTAGKHFRVIDAPTKAIIVPYNEEAKLIITRLSTRLSVVEEANLLKAAQQYSVNIFSYMMEKLHQEKALYQTYEESEIWHLDARYYSKDFGVSLEPVAPMEFLNA
ncbi:MAG: CRISPR-associated helicase Cas3' [Proteobacteria bacterium]|nr:CRISPR-associated helicase Cas3' [Pseudomonadota bacterium]MBU4296136.1 CRISPR-associated helicase Cas3' [Pseudomonadota bacterium]MCG2747454.1 CRISPR-associated helicase Cas3' [Desulfobulbaceae bacterium]